MTSPRLLGIHLPSSRGETVCMAPRECEAPICFLLWPKHPPLQQGCRRQTDPTLCADRRGLLVKRSGACWAGSLSELTPTGADG